MKPQYEGIIMIISCQKHMHTRLVEFRLPHDEYPGQLGMWKVIYVIGDFFLSSGPYKYDADNHTLWLRCEDSYIHLLKKVGLAMKYLYELFDIETGILRMGDDLMINQSNLVQYLQMPNKGDYEGASTTLPYNTILYPKENLRMVKRDTFMVDYYNQHPEDLTNPQHNLMHRNIGDYVLRPNIFTAGGVVMYFSNKACQTIIQHMENVIAWDIFMKDDVNDEFSHSYPYTIEDIGIAFILTLYGIPFTNRRHLYTDDFQQRQHYVAYHTNKYRDD